MAIGDSPADYAWAANDKELQTYSEAYRTIYTGYKPFIPLTQNYSMAVKAETSANAVNQKKGFFQFSRRTATRPPPALIRFAVPSRVEKTPPRICDEGEDQLLSRVLHKKPGQRFL